MTRRLLEDPSFEFGAWLLTCNPKIWDVASFREDGNILETWSVRPSYRLEHMTVGQPVVVWVTGSDDQKETPGVWGVGVISGTPFLEHLSADDDDYWKDADEKRRQDLFVPVSLRLLPEPIERATLRTRPAFDRAEILRSPHMANPQLLTRAEWEIIAAELPERFRDPTSWPVPQILEDKVAERCGVSSKTVEAIAVQLSQEMRWLKREGRAVFHPRGVEAEPNHPAVDLARPWPPPPGEPPRTYLEKRLGSSEESAEIGWLLWPDDLLEADDDSPEGHAESEVIRTLWQVANERGQNLPIVALYLNETEASLLDLVKLNIEDLVIEFGPGQFEHVGTLTDTSVVYRIQNSGDALGVLVDLNRAGEETLAKASRVVDELHGTGHSSAACLVVADGRDAFYRSAEASRDDLFYWSAQDLVVDPPLTVGTEKTPSTESANQPGDGAPRVPERDPERPQDDPYDSNAIRFLLGSSGGSSWTRGTLLEHLRGQSRLDQNRVAEARSFALRHGVEVRAHPDGKTLHFFRSDSQAPTLYPSSEAERREWRANAPN